MTQEFYYPAELELSPLGRIPSRDECITLVQRIVRAARGEGDIDIEVNCFWNGELRWARNRASLSSDRRDVFVVVGRSVRGGRGSALTNQLDDISLVAVVHAAERDALRQTSAAPADMPLPHPRLSFASPMLWSDATFDVNPSARGQWGTQGCDGAESKAMLSAGYVETRAWCVAKYEWPGGQHPVPSGLVREVALDRLAERLQYVQGTQAQCSMTVRHPRGTGSGWAGSSSYDWNTIDGSTLAQRALEKCLLSIDPVRIEPGRYTVVLESQAVCDLVDLILPRSGQSAMERVPAEIGLGPFTMGYDRSLELTRTMLGTKVIDDRITISHNPMDPQLGVLPQPGLEPITWIERGHLTALTYDRQYALGNLNDNVGALERYAYRMSGGATTVEEMIQSTQRGLLVSRFSNLRILDRKSLLATGVTRDGLWLIEKGRISKSVKNMRITESPLFVLNQVDQLGEPVPVFRPVQHSIIMGVTPAVVPPLKANDFSFTATLDAV